VGFDLGYNSMEVMRKSLGTPESRMFTTNHESRVRVREGHADCDCKIFFWFFSYYRTSENGTWKQIEQNKRSCVANSECLHALSLKGDIKQQVAADFSDQTKPQTGLYSSSFFALES